MLVSIGAIRGTGRRELFTIQIVKVVLIRVGRIVDNIFNHGGLCLGLGRNKSRRGCRRTLWFGCADVAGSLRSHFINVDLLCLSQRYFGDVCKSADHPTLVNLYTPEKGARQWRANASNRSWRFGEGSLETAQALSQLAPGDSPAVSVRLGYSLSLVSRNAIVKRNLFLEGERV